MKLPLRNKSIILSTSKGGLFLIIAVIAFWLFRGNIWTSWDYTVLDWLYSESLADGKAVPVSPRVTLLNISDKSYEYWDKNFLDRKDLADVNDILAEVGTQAIAYDVIFPRSSTVEADQIFAQSLENNRAIYLPIGFQLVDKSEPFRWEQGRAFEILRSKYIHPFADEKGEGNPFYGRWALTQNDQFAGTCYSSGHISAPADPDGVYRHYPLVIKVDSLYIPTISLAMFLDFNEIAFEDIEIVWGDHLRIPATEDGFLEKDVIIPIDNRGRMFIPYPSTWYKWAKKIEVQSLLEKWQDPNLQGNLTGFLEGNFVFIGDISVGIADLGKTPLEEDVPLVFVHASLMNALLTNTFYSSLSTTAFLIILLLISLMTLMANFFRNSPILYILPATILLGISGMSWYAMSQHLLIPLSSFVASYLFVFIGLLSILQVSISKNSAFIKDAFSRYVPETVVDELIEKPNLLNLGGTEQVISVLFSDVAGFTTISEKMTPQQLVYLLNRYLSEMTEIVLEEDGIIDKYEGDAIMAEFGAPVAFENHADAAVTAALKMQNRLRELRLQWQEEGLPPLRCRVGINTGPMVVGNMGSDRVFDYTVMGDAVNLSSRLEGANKRYATEIMIGESTYQALNKEKFHIRVLDLIRVKGKSEAVKVYNVYGFAEDELSADDVNYYRSYEKAVLLYWNKKFADAEEEFKRALVCRQDDLATEDFLTRIEKLDRKKLDKNWDGSLSLTEK